MLGTPSGSALSWRLAWYIFICRWHNISRNTLQRLTSINSNGADSGCRSKVHRHSSRWCLANPSTRWWNAPRRCKWLHESAGTFPKQDSCCLFFWGENMWCLCHSWNGREKGMYNLFPKDIITNCQCSHSWSAKVLVVWTGYTKSVSSGRTLTWTSSAKKLMESTEPCVVISRRRFKKHCAVCSWHF